MNKTTKALKLAEEALNHAIMSSGGETGCNHSYGICFCKEEKALAAIREVLAEPVKQEPPLDAWADEQQEWAKLDGTTAFHLIERHAEDWAETGAMMEAWLRARSQPVVQEPVAWGNLADGVKDEHRFLTKDKAAAKKYHEQCYNLTELYAAPIDSIEKPIDAKAIPLSQKTKEQIRLENEVAIKTDLFYLVGRAEMKEECAKAIENYDPEDKAVSGRGILAEVVRGLK